MALKKTIVENNGITTEYHKINLIEVSPKTKEGYILSVSISSFVNEEMRQKSNANSAIDRQYIFRVSAADVENKSIHKVAYAELKKQKLFEGAEDC